MGIKIRKAGDRCNFFCPGCEETHSIPIAGGSAIWSWNGSFDKPTFGPSIKVTGGHFVPGFIKGSACWCTYNAEHPDAPASFKCGCCHSFVSDGKIQFLADCTHGLAGRTVDLPDWDGDEASA